MVRFDFKNIFESCKYCKLSCSHSRNCYKQCREKYLREAAQKLDIIELCKTKSPQQIADEDFKKLGYNFNHADVYTIMSYYNIPIKSIQEANKSQQRQERYKKTCLEKYGDINALGKNSPLYEKRNKTVKEKYGVDNVFQTLEVKEKIKNSIFEHFGDYQGFYEYCSKKFKEKFGVENPWLLQEVQEKCHNTQIERYGKFGNNIHFLSSIHQKVSEFLSSMNIEHENENTRLLRFKDENGKLRWPVPDIHLLGNLSNIIIEVNGDYFHANPKIYKENDLLKRFGGYKKAKDIWEQDLWRNSHIEKLGYKVLVIWESDIKDGSFCEKILNFIKI